MPADRIRRRWILNFWCRTLALASSFWVAGCPQSRREPEKKPAIPLPEGPWTTACLEKGRAAHGREARLIARDPPTYDLSKIRLTSDKLRFIPGPESSLDLKDVRVGRIIGVAEARNLDEGTREEVEKSAARWEGLRWMPAPEDASVLRSSFLYFVKKNDESFDSSQIRVFGDKDKEEYTKLYASRLDLARKNRLVFFSELEDLPRSLPEIPHELWGLAFSGLYQGLISFRAIVVETYRADGSEAGCLPVDHEDLKPITDASRSPKK